MFKIYSRLNRIKLQRPIGPKSNLEKILVSRKSFHGFSSKPVSKKEISRILFFAGGIVRVYKNDPTRSGRPYPSAGSKYPLEIYPLVLHGKDLDRGLYHYNVIEHSLEKLLAPIDNKDIEDIWMTQKWFKKASVIFLITAVYQRTTIKYGMKGIGYDLIEAGHLGQNIYLVTQSLGIGCSAIGEFKEKQIINLLDINPDEEIPIYYIALGN